MNFFKVDVSKTDGDYRNYFCYYDFKLNNSVWVKLDELADNFIKHYTGYEKSFNIPEDDDFYRISIKFILNYLIDNNIKDGEVFINSDEIKKWLAGKYPNSLLEFGDVEINIDNENDITYSSISSFNIDSKLKNKLNQFCKESGYESTWVMEHLIKKVVSHPNILLPIEREYFDVEELAETGIAKGKWFERNPDDKPNGFDNIEEARKWSKLLNESNITTRIVSVIKCVVN